MIELSELHLQFSAVVADILECSEKDASEKMRIGAHQAAPIHKDRRRAAHLELLPIGLAGLDGRRSLRASHTAPKGLGIQPSLAGKVAHLRPGVGRRNQLLLVIDQIVDLPERLGILFVSAMSRKRRGPRPGMQRLQREILEHHAHLRKVRQHAAQHERTRSGRVFL